MTTTEAPPTTEVTKTATVLASELMRAITNAAMSASSDDTLPAITAIHFRPAHSPGMLMLEATNRYVASQEEIELDDLGTYDSDMLPNEVLSHMVDDHGFERPNGYYAADGIEQKHDAKHDEGADHEHTVRPVPVTELDALVNVKDAVKLVKTLKLVADPGTKYAGGRERPYVVISTEDDKVSFALVNNLGMDTTIAYRAVETYNNTLPKLDAMFDAVELGEPESSYAFNPDYLSVYTKVDPGERNVPVEFYGTRKGKPVLVKIGPRYRALIVPLRAG